MKTVILAEKPKQAIAYASAFKKIEKKNGYYEIEDPRFFPNGAILTWAVGHVIELFDPDDYDDRYKRWNIEDLPIVPERFQFKVLKEKMHQFKVIKQLVSKSDEVIIATDAGREGENIAYLILLLSGAMNKKIKRLWISSTNKDAVVDGFKNLRDGKETYGLFKEAQTRQFSDWLVGMNLTRLYTALLQQKGFRDVFSVGRVQTPTLFLVFKRQLEIENFKPVPFFEIDADVRTDSGIFKAKLGEKFKNRDEVKEFLSKYSLAEVNNAVISDVETKLKETKSPELFTLGSLQTMANKKWGYSPKKSLDIVQRLYDNGYLTYPRTDCKYIGEGEFSYLVAKAETYKQLLGLDIELTQKNPRKRYVDESKLTDHYAIIPTVDLPQIESLSKEEQNIYTEVLKTTLAMLAPDYEYEETKVKVNVNGAIFKAQGNVEKKKGWKQIFSNDKATSGEEENKVSHLPVVKIGDEGKAKLSIEQKETKPPKPYTEGSLIAQMESIGKTVENEEDKKILKEAEGIGTSATRAGIIEKLKSDNYIVIDKKKVVVTDKGKILCSVIQGTLLASAEMTAQWEKYLKTIGQNKGDQNVFLGNIKKFVNTQLKQAPVQIDKYSSAIQAAVKSISEAETVGKCPSCGKAVKDKGKFYGCEGYKDGCKFTLPKVFLGKKLGIKAIQSLLTKGKTATLKGFKSKQDKTFSAALKMNNGKLELEFEKKKSFKK